MTGMDNKQFIAAMMRLCEPKVKILLKEVNKPVFKDDEAIRVNDNFQSSSIRCNLLPAKVTKRKVATLTDEERAQARLGGERGDWAGAGSGEGHGDAMR